MGRQARNTRAKGPQQEETEPQSTTVAADWSERDIGALLRESEAERRRSGRLKFDDSIVVYSGYPPRYKYEGAMLGDQIVRYLNSSLVESRNRVKVRVLAFSSLSTLRAENDSDGAKRIIELVEHLGQLNREVVGKYNKELMDEIQRLLTFYADRQVAFADSGQSKSASTRGIAFVREPLELVVGDGAKLRKSIALLLSALDELDQGQHCSNLRETLRTSVELADQAIARGPSTEEHRVYYYVMELFGQGLLNRLRRCACSCGCRRWLYQIRHTHTVCNDCGESHHIKSQEVRDGRNRQARQRYHLKKGNVK
jgi:hypothetical protein